MTEYRALMYADGSCTLEEKRRWMWRTVTTYSGDMYDMQCVVRRFESLDSANASIAIWRKEERKQKLHDGYVETIELTP